MNSHQQLQQNTQMGSGLTRYRSAPSSCFASLMSSPGSCGGFGADDFAQLFNPRASSPETQAIFSRFMNTGSEDTCPSNMGPQQNPVLQPPRKTETVEYQPQQLQRQRSNDYSSASQMMYANHKSEAAPAVDTVFTSFNSCAATQPVMIRPAAAAATSSLIRHSSSPAGLFANINIKNEHLMFQQSTELNTMRGVGCANAEAPFSTGSRPMSRMDYSSKRAPSRMMDTIQEIGSKDMRENAADDEDHGNDVDYITGLPDSSWEDSALMSDHYYLKGCADSDNKIFFNANASDDQKNEAADRPKTQLSHHLSLPKSPAMEKLLQDSVPCKIRAKRGCATHPRSIAERVRRTKISERMRKLQELVPNMEKQTNTSDMLDLAVDYIKELQRQVKALSDNQAKCNCSAKKRP